MAERVCQMCSKANPEAVDFCLSCGARLLPLPTPILAEPPAWDGGEHPPADDAGEPGTAAVDESSIETASVEESTQATSNSEGLPTWLRELGREAVPDAAAFEDGSPLELEPPLPADEKPHPEFPAGEVPAPDLPSGTTSTFQSDPAPANQVEAGDLPVWLSQLRDLGAGTGDEAPLPGAEEEGEEDELPIGEGDGSEWIQRLEEKATPAVEAAAVEGDIVPIPDGGGAVINARLPVETGAAAAANSEEQPSESATTAEMGESSPIQSTDGSDGTAPDEVTEIEIPAAESIRTGSEGSEGEKALPEEELPEWLNRASAEAGSGPAFEEKMPSWLNDLKDSLAEAETGKAAAGAEIQPPSSEEDPGVSLRSPVEPAPLPGENQGEEPGLSVEMPAWLAGIQLDGDEKNQAEVQAESSAVESLPAGELPEWVQALKPVEAVVAGVAVPKVDESTLVEQQGPLAGMNGILPLGPGLGQLPKPPTYSNLLKISDSQQKHIQSLERLLADETRTGSSQESLIPSNRFLRWLVAGILILVVAVSLVSGSPRTPASMLQPPEMVNAFAAINRLAESPAAMPVLLVFDYDPAFSAELEAASAALIDHLLLQGPRLVVISTSPTGPALADRMLQDANVSPGVAGHNYQAGQQYVNLGYLAGGPSGVQFFTVSPPDAAPYSQDGSPAWEEPPLQGIRSLADFAAIVLLTDDGDRGRTWIEQVSAASDQPIIMVISAQAEPLILPYYDSGQVMGLVTGLAGGGSYENIYNPPGESSGQAARYWEALGAGTLSAVILILAGMVSNLVNARRTRRSRTGGNA